MRINKLLSDAGLGSRREVEAYVTDGRVMINGQKAILSDVVEEDDIVTLDGEELPVRELIREYAAEQKELLAAKARMYVDDDFDDDFEPNRKRANSNKGKGAAFSKGPAKFKKNQDYYDEPANGKGKAYKPEKKFHKEKPHKAHNFANDEEMYIPAMPRQNAESRPFRDKPFRGNDHHNSKGRDFSKGAPHHSADRGHSRDAAPNRDRAFSREAKPYRENRSNTSRKPSYKGKPYGNKRND